MKTIQRSLLLLAGIAANILIACGGDGAKDDKAPYSTYDNTRPMEHKNAPDTAGINPGGRTTGFDQPAQ